MESSIQRNDRIRGFLKSSRNFHYGILSLLATGSNEDLLEAAKLLSKRDDAEALSLATEMACKAGATEFASNLSLYCVRVCLLQNKWEAASDKLSAYSFGDSEQLRILVECHKILGRLRKESPEPSDNAIWKWIQGDLDYGDLLVERLTQWWNLYQEKSEEIQNSVSNISCGDPLTPLVLNQMWLMVSEKLSWSCFYKERERLRCFVQAIYLCYQYQVHHPKKHCCLQLAMWLTPKGPLNDIILKYNNEANAALLKSLRAFIGADIFNWFEEFCTRTLNKANCSDLVDSESALAEEEKDNPINIWGKSMESNKWNCITGLIKEFLPDVLDKDNIAYFKEQIEIKKLEQEVASSVVRSNKDDNTDNFTSQSEKLKQLQLLNQRKDTFELDRVAKPNPFVTYCKMLSICQVVETYNPDSAGLLEEVKFFWTSNLSSLE